MLLLSQNQKKFARFDLFRVYAADIHIREYLCRETLSLTETRLTA